MLILDSNTISYFFRGDPLVQHLQALRPADLGVPAIVEYELRYGLLLLPRHDLMLNLCKRCLHNCLGMTSWHYCTN